MTITRRQALLGAGFCIAAPAYPLKSNSIDGSLQQLAASLHQQFGGNLEMKRLGQRWLEAEPQQLDNLLQAIQVSLSPTGPASTQNRLVLQLNTQIQTDFVSDRTRKVAGWLLSETEARLCAVTHLLQS